MSRIRSKDTNPERVVRSLLHRMGYRFRLHVRSLPGAPDMVLPRHQTVIFINGCFWHRHAHCPLAYVPKSRTEFWEKKFSENVARQRRANEELEAMGWRVVVVWECELSDPISVGQRLSELLPRT